jgi:hypothetical protein
MRSQPVDLLTETVGGIFSMIPLWVVEKKPIHDVEKRAADILRLHVIELPANPCAFKLR